ncbi:MAG: anthranilate phosphoribosyltransferase [Acidobacteria bacterium]|nr:anthranilate phosphoribosyltransferase [Acidobacteriota bacterium]MBI3423567.1 anthranilate phosphoribosyltransferase [Acidobacteriota bacterium]
MLQPLLNKLMTGADLAQTEAAQLLDALLADDVTDAQIAAALIALALKGETAEELAGFATTMRGRAARIVAPHAKFIDTCGTGGSPAKTFNVSTAAAFVVAAAGLPVAKHGNVGVTSKAGSADVLRALGVRVDLPPARVGEIFAEIGLCFMFAPLHHAATKRVAIVRRELGVRTIFNLLGPLTNPAGAPFQVIGVSNAAAVSKVAHALAHLGTQRAWVVRGEDGLDEITLAGRTLVYEVAPAGVEQLDITPGHFDVPRHSLETLRGESAAANAATIRAILQGELTGAARDLVLINAAANLYVAELCDSLQAAFELARETVESGAALAKLEALREVSQ